MNANNQNYTYDDLGEKLKTLYDENGTIQTYIYDVLGRMSLDEISLPGSGVDASVRSIGYMYDPNGQLSTASTYASATGGGTPLTQVEEAYNGLGQLVGEYQSHSGAVDTNATLEVAASCHRPGALPRRKAGSLWQEDLEIAEVLGGNAQFLQLLLEGGGGGHVP